MASKRVFSEHVEKRGFPLVLFGTCSAWLEMSTKRAIYVTTTCDDPHWRALLGTKLGGNCPEWSPQFVNLFSGYFEKKRGTTRNVVSHEVVGSSVQVERDSNSFWRVWFNFGPENFHLDSQHDSRSYWGLFGCLNLLRGVFFVSNVVEMKFWWSLRIWNILITRKLISWLRRKIVVDLLSTLRWWSLTKTFQSNKKYRGTF